MTAMASSMIIARQEPCFQALSRKDTAIAPTLVNMSHMLKLLEHIKHTSQWRDVPG